MNNTQEKIALLKKSEFFQSIPVAYIEGIAEIMKPVRFSKNQAVVRRGDEDDDMYIIRSGKVKVHYKNLTIAKLGEGDVFGELALLCKGPRTMSVTALEDSQLYSISRKDFDQAINGKIIASRGIVNVLVKRERSNIAAIIEQFQKREQKLTAIVDARTKALMQKNKQLLQAQEFEEQFLATMSHEIRTPMNSVIGLTNLLLGTRLSKKQVKYLKAIEQSAENMLVILNDIIDFSKIQAGKLEIDKTDFSVRKVVENVVDAFNYEVERKNVRLESFIESHVPELVVGDPVRLSEILMNLVNNAMKFTHAGSIEITVRVLSRDNGTVNLEFNVKDTGIGIPKDKLDVIFKSFVQGGREIMRKYGGTGLGLAICKRLVHLQKGQIKVQSTVGSGSVFTFNIPHKISRKQKDSSPQKTSHSKDLSNLKILLVEDNDFNMMVAKDTLSSIIKDSKLDAATNGEEAIRMLKKNTYDVVLMDLNMPIMDGYEATRLIRDSKVPEIRKVKIIALTASATREEREACYKSGMDEYISKPFVPEELYGKIFRLVRGKN